MVYSSESSPINPETGDELSQLHRRIIAVMLHRQQATLKRVQAAAEARRRYSNIDPNSNAKELTTVIMAGVDNATIDAVVEGIPHEELTVERVRSEVKQLTDKIAAKQLEVQLMVGSRYHELIESADSVVSMYRSCKRLQLILGHLKSQLQKAAERRPAVHLKGLEDPIFHPPGPQPGDAPVNTQVEFMVHAPTAIWTHMDSHRHLDAANALLEAQHIADLARAHLPATQEQAEVRRMVLAQWSYIAELRGAIRDGARSLMHQQDVAGIKPHAEALSAICVLEGHGSEDALSLFVASRSKWVQDALKEAGAEDAEGDTVRSAICRAVRAIVRTLLEAHVIFMQPSMNGGGSSSTSSSHRLTTTASAPALSSLDAKAVVGAMTAWTENCVTEVHRQCQDVLKRLRVSNELAAVRQALWEETHLEEEEETTTWRSACASCLNIDRLRPALTRSLNLTYPLPNGPLDLWALLFSRTFASLAEDLLRESFARMKGGLVQRLEAAIGVVREGAHGRLTAHEMAWAAERIGRALTKDVQGIAAQAQRCLVQEEDQTAGAALSVSLRSQTLQLLAQVSAYLRAQARRLAEGNIVEGLLIVARLMCHIQRRLGSGLDPSADDDAWAKRRAGMHTLDQVQLESAFTIADTRGAGELTSTELREALDSLGVVPGDGELPSMTFPEMALLCSPLLHNGKPSTFLDQALATAFASTLTAWARVTIQPLSLSFRTAAANVAQAARFMADAEWRERQPGWEEKVILQEDEGGRTLEDRMWIPTQVSPHLGLFLFSLSCEVARATQSRDCLEPSLAPEQTTMFESIRMSVLTHAREELEATLGPLRGDGMCESAVIQSILDFLFLRQWLDPSMEQVPPSPFVRESTWLSTSLKSLTAHVDPINYETYEPHLRETLQSYSSDTSLLLSHLCCRGAAPSASYSSSLSTSMSTSRTAFRRQHTDDRRHVLSSMPLVPPIPRFTLLPVVIEPTTPASTRLSPPRDLKAKQAAAAGASHGLMPVGAATGAFSFTALDGAALAGAKGAVGNAVSAGANVLSSFSLTALGNTAASKASSWLGGGAKRS